MFGILKKKLKESVQKLIGKARGEAPKEEVKKPELKGKPEIKKIEKKHEAKKPEEKKIEKKPESKKQEAEKKHHVEYLAEKVRESAEEIKKEIEHIEEEQTSGVVEDEESPLQEEIKEEAVEEESEEEVESAKEPVVEPFPVEPEEKIEEELKIRIPEPEIPKEKKSFKERLFGKVKFKALTEKDINDFFDEIESDLLSANIAIEVVEFLRKNLKEELVGKEASRLKTDKDIKDVFAKALEEVLKQEPLDIENVIKKAKKEGRPALLLFLGFNGAGKTTNLAKVGYLLKNKGYSVVFAAADCWRSAAIEQLEEHGKKLDIKVIKHQYGSDPAAVVFDAVKHAQAKGIDVVLADSAGRSHANANLADELKKIIRVNKPDLNVLVLDSLAGNDIVSQCEKFDQYAGIHGMILTKLDVDEKGGAILSAAYVTKKPILYIGIGQKYEDLKAYNYKEIAKQLLS